MIKIATYNVNGINDRLTILLRWLKEAKPDVVCLQELKAPNDRFPLAAIEAAGYQAIWNGQKAWNGVAILSRSLPIQEVRRKLPGDKLDDHSRYLEAIVGKLLIACIYLPHGNPYPSDKFDFKLKWFKRLNAHAKKILAEDVPALLVGDFNVMPTELDSYKPEKYINDAMFRKEVRDAYFRLLNQGWTDALRTLYPNERIYTFWDYLRFAWQRDAGLRLDHFLLNAPVVKMLRKGGVDKHVRGWEKSSDHAPAWIELREPA